jgi:ATP/maltotriose-dependent transcriptional regulator MalT
VRPSVLIARDSVLAGLEEQLLRAGEHGPAMVLLTGAQGVGRSTVLERLAAGHDGPVLRARATAWECSHPGAVLAQLLDGDPGPEDALAAASLLVGRMGGKRAPASLVAVDDAHHADPFSLQVLSSAVRHHRAARFLAVLTAPTTRPATTGATAHLLAHEPDRRILLEPLAVDDLTRLAAAHGVALSPWLAARLHRHTGGLPGPVTALLEELPRAVWSETEPALPAPAAVAAQVRDTLSALPPDVRRLAEVAAVLASPSPISLVVALAGVEDVWAVVERAEHAGLVLVSGPPAARLLAPADLMVAAAVRAEAGPVRTASLHTAAAGLVADQAVRLRHLVAAAAAPDPALADELAALAAERSAQGAWGEAAALLTDASRLTTDRLAREARLTLAVDALVGAGDGPGAAALVPEVESLRETPLREAVLGYLAILRGRGTEAEARLDRAWELVNVAREPRVAALIAQRYVLHALVRCRWDELVSWADRALDLAGPDDPAAIEAAAIRGLGLVARGQEAEARSTYAALAESVPHGAQAQRIVLGMGWLHLALDDVDAARAELESAVPTSFRGGSARISLWARAWLARTQFLTGEWDRALDTVAAAQPLLRQSNIVLAGPIMDWTAVQIHALRGEWDPAQDALLRAESAPQDYEVMLIPTCLARAALAEAQADDAGVVRALQPLTAPAMREAVAEPGFWPWADLYASALVALGRHDEADDALRDHEARAAARGHRSAAARLGRTRGRLHAAQGDLTQARTSFEAAMVALDGLPLRFDRARVEFAYGQVLRRAGKRREADVLISSARDLFVALGAVTYVARCDRELKAGGVHATRAERGPAELTPQEEAISELVARGLSNREVAAELYVSTKTVQYHLTRIYGKLGIRSRAELAAQRGHPLS